ncbi:MAG: hypothetical protein ACOC58_00020 [Chloroflexota bacterium]
MAWKKILLEGDVGGAADYPMKLKPATTRWVLPGWYAYTLTTLYPTSGMLYYIPLFVSETTTYIRIAIEVQTGASGSARLGIYNWSNGLPGSLVLDAGTVSTLNAGVQEIVISQQLTRGYYFGAMVCNAAPSLRGPNQIYAVRPPLPGFQTGAALSFRVIMGCSGRGGDVAGGLADPAPAPDTYDLMVSYAFLRFREN